MTNLILAYCVENQFVAAKIASAVASQIEVERVIFNSEHGIETLGSRAENNNAPILLLISDNFLKSEKCMHNAMQILQNLGNAKRLIPVITDGVYSKDGNGHFINVPTSFDRVSNVIQYMNFWQDTYLELRRAKADGQDEIVHSEHVRKVRNISSEVGELLRYLRSMENFTYEQFEESNFIILYRVLGLKVPESATDNLKNTHISHTILPAAESDTFEEIEKESEILPVLETVDIANITTEQHISPIENFKNGKDHKDLEMPRGFDVNAIPGVNLLNLNISDDIKSEAKKIDIAPTVEETIDKSFMDSSKSVSSNIESVHNEMNLEDLIADIKKDERYNIESAEPMTGSSNYLEILEEVVNEDNLIADRVVEEKDDSVLDEIKNIFNQDKTETTEVTLENIYEPNTLNEMAHIVETKAETALETPLSIEPSEPIEMESEPIIEEPLVPVIASEKVETNNIVPENIEEETIKNEVSRILSESEEAESQFEFEKDLEIVALHEKSKTLNGTPKESTTEGVIPESVVKTKLDIARENLSKDPLNNGFRYIYAAELVQNHRFQDTIEQLEILIENDRTHIEAYILMAYAAEQAGDYLLSLSCLEKVTLIKPDYPGIFYKLGSLIVEHFKNQKRKAIHYFKEAIEHDPKNADAYYQLGKLESEQSADFDVIIGYFKNAVTHNPSHADASFELAKAKYEVGDRAQASYYYNKACQNNGVFRSKINDEIFKFEEPIPEPVVNPIQDNGLTVLITGATSGIGLATAEIFAQHGYRLILTGRRGDRLNEIKEKFENEYKNLNQVLEFDVRSLESVKKSIAEIEDEFKNVDILINNAGLASGLAPIHEGDIEDWEVMIDTNIKGLLYMTRAIAPGMVARRKGHIINISSIAGKEVYPNGNVYIATKHAVESLTKAMRIDLHKFNIRVSQVAPGAVEETEFSLVRFHGDSEKAKIYEEFQPLKASDVAESIYFIASRPEYVNIQDITLLGTQQAGANFIDKSGRKDRE